MVSVTLLLYDIFKPVNKGVSLLAASFNLVGFTFGALRWNPRGRGRLALGILGQESVMRWLLVMGVNEQRWKEPASTAVE